MNHFFITYCFLKEQNKVTLTFLKASVLFSKKPEQIQISISVQDGFFLWPLDFFSLPNVNEIKVRSGQWWVIFFLLALTRNFTQAIKVQNCIWYADKKQDWEWSLCLFNGHLMLPPLAVAERGITVKDLSFDPNSCIIGTTLLAAYVSGTLTKGLTPRAGNQFSWAVC